MKKARLLQCMVLILLACIMSQSHAQLIRNFPVDSKFGKLKSFTHPQFKIDKEKQVLILGVGGQIRDTNNMIIMPDALNKTGYIRYQIDNMGFIYRIWFLTPEEIALAKEEQRLLRKQNPQKRFSIPFFQ
ncbi:MAG: hypothetical protein KDF59_07490 [Nitrosomonas sp.]|nr:hypothetical protein [Nitrosomonas sp.]